MKVPAGRGYPCKLITAIERMPPEKRAKLERLADNHDEVIVGSKLEAMIHAVRVIRHRERIQHEMARIHREAW